MSVKKWLVHGIADCTNCDWSEQDYMTVQKKAAKHAKKTGHKVTADLGYAVEYLSDRPRREGCRWWG